MSLVRSVITGLGIVSALGVGTHELKRNQALGNTALRLERSSKRILPGEFALGRVTNEFEKVLSFRENRNYDRATKMALVAARQALKDASFQHEPGVRVAVVISSGMGGLEAAEQTIDQIASGSKNALSPHTIPRIMPNSAAVRVAIEVGAKAGTFAPVSACASGLEAISFAHSLIATDRADVVVAGGTESMMDLRNLDAFAAMRAIGTVQVGGTMSVPFDASRSGFNMGEGSGVVVMESEDHFGRRGGNALAAIGGFGVTSDAFNDVTPEPTGEMQEVAMREALRTGGFDASDVAAVFAHATGTPIGDAAETAALMRLIGDAVPVTAAKSLTGHSIGASGPLALVMAIVSRGLGELPPTAGFLALDPGVNLDISAERRSLRREESSVFLINAFGFGGQNVSVSITVPS